MKPTKIKNKNGKTSYRLQIKNKITEKRESKSFSTPALCKAWADKRLQQIEDELAYGKDVRITVADVINEYQAMYPGNIGRSKGHDLNRLKSYTITRINATELTAADLINHIAERNRVVKPQTAKNDLIWLKTAIKTMSVTMGFKANLEAFEQAREVLRKQKLIASSDTRDRLPTCAEILTLSRHFGKGSPSYECMWFSLYSARRISETTRIKWDDINETNRTVVIRNLKDPNRRNVTKIAKIPLSAFNIIQRQPRKSDRVFPYQEKTISKYFTDACKVVGIEDLHLHDLRHAATTGLFKRGLQIQEVQKITLHSTWQALSRYTNLNPEDIDI